MTQDDFDYVAGDEGYRLVEAVSQWMALACDQEETARLTKSWQIEVNMMSKRYRRLIEKVFCFFFFGWIRAQIYLTSAKMPQQRCCLNNYRTLPES